MCKGEIISGDEVSNIEVSVGENVGDDPDSDEACKNLFTLQGKYEALKKEKYALKKKISGYEGKW